MNLIEILGPKTWAMVVDWIKSDRKKMKTIHCYRLFPSSSIQPDYAIEMWMSRVYCEYCSRHTDYHWWKYNHIIIIVLYYIFSLSILLSSLWNGFGIWYSACHRNTHTQTTENTFIFPIWKWEKKRCIPGTGCWLNIEHQLSTWTWME